MRKVFTLVGLMALLIFVLPVASVFAQIDGVDAGQTIDIAQQAEDNQDAHHEDAGSADESHVAAQENEHGHDHTGPGGESKSAIYVSTLSVVMIFVFLGFTYFVLRKHQKEK